MLFNDPNNPQNADLNSIGSQYAADFNHPVNLMIAKLTAEMIFDASPKMFFDLKMLEMAGKEPVKSDEFFYKEMGYQRSPIIATGTVSAVSYPTSHTFAISDISTAATDVIITYPNNAKGTITAVNLATSEITVTPMTGGSLPAVALSDSFAILSNVEADGVIGFANNFRATTIERYNFVQFFSQAIEYGRVELFKHLQAGTVKEFIAKEKKAMMDQYRLSMSNAFWNGERGEVTVAGGKKAKTMGGLFPTMVAAGSPSTLTPVATMGDALEDIALNTEYGDYGEVRFLFGTSRAILAMSKFYKQTLTRYAPNDMIAQLNLKEVDLGSSRIVFVPMNRLADTASFPSSFANRMFLINPNTIKMKQMWAPMSGETKDRADGIPTTSKYFWVDSNMSIQFNNPLASGYLDVTGL